MKKLICRYACLILTVLSLFGLTVPLNGIVHAIGLRIVCLFIDANHGLRTPLARSFSTTVTAK